MGPTFRLITIVSVFLAGCADAPADAPDPVPTDAADAQVDALNFTFEALPASIMDATLRLQGNVSAPAVVLATVARENASTVQVDADGPWTLTIDVPYGRSALTLSADDGASLIEHRFQLVRLAPVTFEVDYGSTSTRAEVSDAMWIDIDALASRSMYVAEGGAHPGFPNVHDVMVTWEAAFGHTIEFGYNSDFQSFGVNRIDGEGNPLTASAPPWWCYAVNGEAAQLGITLQPYSPGDSIAWNLGTCT